MIGMWAAAAFTFLALLYLVLAIGVVWWLIVLSKTKIWKGI